MQKELNDRIIESSIMVSNYNQLDFQEKVLLACGKVWISDESKYIRDYSDFNEVIDLVKSNLKFCEFLDGVRNEKVN
jgi:hypothetical protein